MEPVAANLHTQSNKPRKRHNARAAENPTKIQRNRTSKLSRVLLPEINKLTYNLIQIPNPAISHAHTPKTNPFSDGFTLKKKGTEIKMSNPPCFAIAKQKLTYSRSHGLLRFCAFANVSRI